MYGNISKYISELLYRHDCVIVPGFGGFVARHVPAGIFNSGGLISPPAKSVLFNKNLQNNDGLLANHIMEKHLLSYTEANKCIADFVSKSFFMLDSSKRLELENIGILYVDTEKNIQFEPEVNVNYLIESFGLSPVFAQPLLSTETPKPIETAFKDRLVVAEQQPVKKQKNYKRIAAIVIGAQLLLAGFIISTQTAQLSNTAWANLNPFAKSIEAKYSATAKKQKFTKYIPTMRELLLPDANGYASLRLNENSEAAIVVNIEAKAVTTDKTSVKKHSWVKKSNLSLSGNFQIVLGCFALEENALRHINTLHTRNIAAVLNGVNKTGMHVVSAGTYTNLDQAREALNRIRQNYPHAWLMIGK